MMEGKKKSSAGSNPNPSVLPKSFRNSGPSATTSLTSESNRIPVPVRDSFKTEMPIPGNTQAKFSIVQQEPSTRLSMKNAHDNLHELEKAPPPRPSILRILGQSPSQLAMETMKQNQSLARLASERHNTLVSAQNAITSSVQSVSHTRPNPEQGSKHVLRKGSRDNTDNSLRLSLAPHPSQSQMHIRMSRKSILEPVPNPPLEGAAAFVYNKRLTVPKTKRAGRVKADKEWEVVTTVSANELHSVARYRSVHTGMEVVHAKVDSPTVHAYFVFATKCENDWGLPHIMEHMVFLGSRNFPYHGVIDHLSSICMASGARAWTDSDHTCYTVITAGKEGFLSLLPVYMDHLFYPLLAEAGYLTEVHHITGEGKDSGVVYNEMKTSEHDPLEHAQWSLIREIYDSTSGYYNNYAGYCTEMRDSCSLQAVREFHKKFYHPRNACLIVCGDLSKEEIFHVLTPYIEILYESRASPRVWKKPWSTEPPVEIPEDIESIVEFPSEHEGFALVKLGIVGPTVTGDITKSVGMHLIIEYLIRGPLSPIQLEFVEHDEALAAHAYVTEINHIQTVFCITFENVAQDSMHSIPKKLRDLLIRQIESEFDLSQMEYVVNHCYQQTLSAMENAAEEQIANAVIQDFLYSFKDDNGLMFDRRINNAYTIEQFINQPASLWLTLMQSLVDTKWATIYMVPSKHVHEEHLKQEEERLETIQKKLGTSGKKKLANRLKAAKKIQEKAPPAEMMNLTSSPSISSIGFLAIERLANPAWASDTLCNVYLDDINSTFVYLTVMMDTVELTFEEKKYLVLFAEAIFGSAYEDSSKKFYSYEQLVAGLDRDVLKYESYFGLDWDSKIGTRFSCGSYSHLFCIRFQLEMKKVKEGFAWMQILLWNTKWQGDRLKIIAHRLASDVTLLQDHGGVMTHALLADSLYQANSNVRAINLIRQQMFLRQVAEGLPKSFKKVAKMLEAIRMVILRPENTTVHVAADLSKMDFYLTDKPEVRDSIPQLLKRTFDYTGWNWAGYETKRLANARDYKYMRNIGCIAKCLPELILRMHSDEDSYLLQAAPCIQSYNDPEYPLLLTAIHYFCQQEGPLFKELKLNGYASGFEIKMKPTEGMIYFELKPASDLVAAYCGAFDVITNHLNNPKVWDELLLQDAKSSMIFELIETENTPRTLAMNSLMEYYHECPPGFSRNLMRRIKEVTMNEVQAMTKKYFRGLIIETTSCAVAAPADQVKGIIKGLTEHCGKRLSLLPPVHQSQMSGFY